MKSVILTKYGAPEVLKVKELKDLEPLNNQVRIKVHYAGINFAEIMARMKLYPGGPKPGSVLGGEVSGVIDKLGKDVQGLSIGEKVMGLSLNGSYSSQVCIDADSIIKLPGNFKLDGGAMFGVIPKTLWESEGIQMDPAAVPGRAKMSGTCKPFVFCSGPLWGHYGALVPHSAPLHKTCIFLNAVHGNVQKLFVFCSEPLWGTKNAP